MGRRSPLLSLVPVLLLFAAACAPDDLDITPTAAPTPVPLITVYVTGAVAEPGSMIEIEAGSRAADAIEAAGGALDDADMDRVNIAELLDDGAQVHVPAIGESLADVVETTPEAEVATGPAAQLDSLLSALPGTLNAGAIRWNRVADAAPLVVEREGGTTARVSYAEAGGGALELTLGVFENVEAARAYYDSVRDSLLTLDRAQERDIFPTPNAFGGGTYGWDAVLVPENTFVRVSVPRISSTAGDPLIPTAREVLRFLEAQGVGGEE